VRVELPPPCHDAIVLASLQRNVGRTSHCTTIGLEACNVSMTFSIEYYTVAEGKTANVAFLIICGPSSAPAAAAAAAAAATTECHTAELHRSTPKQWSRIN